MSVSVSVSWLRENMRERGGEETARERDIN